jgi:hypothetical protein
LEVDVRQNVICRVLESGREENSASDREWESKIEKEVKTLAKSGNESLKVGVQNA